MLDTPEDEQDAGFEFPPEYATLIAKVVSSWSAMEYHISLSIWHLAGVYPAVGACITSQSYTMDGRFKALAALLKLRQAPASLIKMINRFTEKCRRPLEFRNRVVHDQWQQSTIVKEMFQLEIGAKGSLTYGFNRVLLSDLQFSFQKLRRVMREAAAIRIEIESLLPTLPEIPLRELHPTVLHAPDSLQTRSIDNTFLLYPPKPSPA